MNNIHANPVSAVGPSITVRFVGQAPDEEVLHFAVGCARKRAVGRITVVVERCGGAAMHEVRIERRGIVLVSESDLDVLIAVRNAFDRLSGDGMPVGLGGGEAGGRESVPFWA